MERAWAQIAAADTPEVQTQLLDDAMEWTMLDKEYDDRARRTFTGPIFVPMWWGRYDPGYGRSVGTSRPLSVGTSRSFITAQLACPVRTLQLRWWAAYKPSRRK